jgi:hypothetical protein
MRHHYLFLIRCYRKIKINERKMLPKRQLCIVTNKNQQPNP